MNLHAQIEQLVVSCV